MGHFRFVTIEKNWQDAYSSFDDDEIKEYIRNKIDEGYSRDDIQDFVEEKLQDNCWNDVDYGEVFDSETVDTDFDDDSEEGLQSVVCELIDSVYEDALQDGDVEAVVLGGLGDD